MRINHRRKYLYFIASTIDGAGFAIDADARIEGLTSAQRCKLFLIAKKCKDIADDLRELAWAMNATY